jgi:hypothetical protein
VCVCYLRYPACYAHAPYFHMWPVRFYQFFHISLYLCCSVVICVVRLLFVFFGCYLCFSVVICVFRLLFVFFGCYLRFRLLFVLFGCYLCCSVYCLCVNVYCHRVTTQLQLINISYIKWHDFREKVY